MSNEQEMNETEVKALSSETQAAMDRLIEAENNRLIAYAALASYNIEIYLKAAKIWVKENLPNSSGTFDRNLEIAKMIQIEAHRLEDKDAAD